MPSPKDAVRLLLPPQLIPSERHQVWFNGLVASPTLISCSYVVEFSEREPDLKGLFMQRPEVWLALRSPDRPRPVKAMWSGGGSVVSDAMVGVHQVRWDPYELPPEPVFSFTYDRLGVRFAQRFTAW